MAEMLKQYKNDKNVVVLAIPRGGIIPGDIIAKYLNAPLEILLVKKIGHPMNKECAIGAVSLNDRIITNPEFASNAYIEDETLRVRNKIKEQYKMFFGDRKPIRLKGKKVIITDDGIATGNTLLMVIHIVKNADPDQIIVAVPVSPPEIIEKLRSMVDHVICLETPLDFNAVGSYYRHFSQVEDGTVLQLLNS